MAASPQFKVYNARNEYVAATKEVHAAAALASLYGDGTTIRYDHAWILWTEGHEAIGSAESYDTVSDTVYSRLAAKQQEAYAKAHASSGGGRGG